MVGALGEPRRPLPRGGATWLWRWRNPTARAPWRWCRIYHRSKQVPTGDRPRDYGPLHRFDPHTHPAGDPGIDPVGRSVLYVSADLATSACEVFGEVGEAALCPQWRVALLRPLRQLTMFDLTAPGSAMSIGALPALADAAQPRSLTQAWARAIYEDEPTGKHLDGIRYRSAYNGGNALALWDIASRLAVSADGKGTPQDFELRSRPIYARLIADLRDRHITVRLQPRNECSLCQRQQ